MKLICYKNCSTCKKVEKTLDEKNISYDKRDIKDENPNRDELKSWHEQSNLDIKRFFNTSGKVYRDLNLKEKLLDMSLEEKYDLLSTDGMLVKRPIIFTDEGEIFVGPDARKYVEDL
ncbi:MAG: Spx/MgsR family RNA polymerase-binding regulatory protein [Tissierellia bacterium]|nr:Spx/MgsR family RNA polymerase-binding regulatory protein [Tissierellia bacterium]